MANLCELICSQLKRGNELINCGNKLLIRGHSIFFSSIYHVRASVNNLRIANLKKDSTRRGLVDQILVRTSTGSGARFL